MIIYKRGRPAHNALITNHSLTHIYTTDHIPISYYMFCLLRPDGSVNQLENVTESCSFIYHL